jgi:hypothetical protein
MMTGMFLVARLPLILPATWYPSMPGIMMSSRMRSGGSVATMASASSPLAALRRTKPSGLSITSSSCLLWRSSSTIRMRATWSIVSGLGIIFRFVTRALRRLGQQVGGDRRQKVPVCQRLGDVTVTAIECARVALRERGELRSPEWRASRVLPEQDRRREPSMPGS